MRFPENLKYTKEHEWAKLDDKNVVLIGITDHAQNSLGDIVFVDLPEVGRQLKSSETFGVVESIKAVSDLYSPLTGKVIAVNSALKDDPSQLNREPYSAWMIKLEVAHAADPLSGLLDQKEYAAYVETQK
ncbi:MAG: glycine cleavage system protein GcvH [Bdellovibrionota bacterium]